MKEVCRMDDGSRIVLVGPADEKELSAALVTLTKLLMVFPKLESPAPTADAAHVTKTYYKAARLKFNPGPRPGGPAKKATGASAEKLTRSGRSRNKKCAGCGIAFYDDTRTNVRKWCGAGGCSRAKGGGIRSSDLPKRHGRTLPIIPDESAGGGRE